MTYAIILYPNVTTSVVANRKPECCCNWKI